MKYLWSILMLLLFHGLPAAENEALQVVRITPTGENVPGGRQIVIQFNHDVVAIGRMQRNSDEIRVSISPAVDCQWRWLDRSSLACQLDEKKALRQATDYAITVWPGITDRQGNTLLTPFAHRFTTERPKISRVWFKTWKAPGFPVMAAVFNQPVTAQSVTAHVFFSIADQHYAVTVHPDPDDQQKAISTAAGAARTLWVLQPQQPLPLDSAVELQSEPGLVSAFGPLPGNEQRVVVAFDTFPEFKFNGIACHNTKNKEILVNNANYQQIGKCDPLKRVALSFSVPVLNSEISKKIRFNPDLSGGRKDYDPWANREDYSRLQRIHKKGQSYDVWLPEILKADQLYRVTTHAGEQIHDEFGRSLAVQPQMSFFTDHRLPDFTLAHHQSVLEKSVDSELPLYVTNLRKLKINYKKLTRDSALSNQFAGRELPKVEDISFAVPLNVRDMLPGQSGAVYGRIDSEPQIGKSAYERHFFAQVSPYQVHVKLGHFNTLVWVTDFAGGQPVADAQVSIYRDAVANLSQPDKLLATANTDADGIAILAGSSDLDPELKTFSWSCFKDDCPRLMVRVDKQQDMALLPLSRHFEVNTYRASGYSVFSRQQTKYGHIHSWGMTAQGVYRAGDTLQYKFYVRNQDNRRFVVAPKGDYQLEIIDPAGKAIHTLPNIELSEFGAYSGEFKIPESALVGWYRFRLKSNFSKHQWQPMRVLVSDFTPSPFKVSTRLNGERFKPGDELQILTAAKLHSGGAYSDAPVRVTVKLQSRYFSSTDPLAKGFAFYSYKQRVDKMLLQQIQSLDVQGENRRQLKLPDNDIVYGKLLVESSVRDDRGKYIAASASADYVSVDRLIGLKSSRWLFDAGKPADVYYLVVDAEGRPATGTAAAITIDREETVAARVKGAGNAYLTQFNTQWRETGRCQGVSDTEPLTCRFTPEHPGTYRLTAKIKDTRGKAQQSELKIWVAGKGQVVWAQPDDNSLQIIPEQQQYNIGDTARYLVKNPYPGANALITLERYGVIKQWLQKWDDSTAIVEFPIDKDLLPGFYLSAVVMSPRIAKPLGDGQVDLGKPAFKIGYVKVPVSDPRKQIDVAVSTDAPLYKPGDWVNAHIRATLTNPENPEPIELAVAVLDEAVLDLISAGKRYFDPYRGFYHLDNLDLQNYSLLTRLIGRQKFEKKGANAGGDGGHTLSMRSMFKYVSYWNPSIKTDADGNADIAFKLPDNLTGWRILVLAVTPGERMGLGDVNFKVNQPTEIRPVMPNQVTEGDVFQAGFSVMNRTNQQRKITVAISAVGNLQPLTGGEQTITLQPYQRKTVFVPVTTLPAEQRRDIGRGEIRFTAKAYDQIDADGLEFQLPVLKRRAMETAADYGSTTADQAGESIEIPPSIYPHSGTISVLLSPTVIGNVDGAFRYLRDYPYVCWEQKLTKGVMAAQFAQIKPWLEGEIDWPESAGLPEIMLSQAANYQAPNGGMAYYLAQDTYVSPYLSAYTALAFNWLRAAGHSIPQAVEQKLHQYLHKMLRKEVLPDFYDRGMASTVRAVALAALSGHGALKRSDIERYRAHLPYMSLFGKAHYLQAAQAVGGNAMIVNEVLYMIVAHAQQSGGKISFSEQLDDGYQRLLSTPMRTNCAVLSSLLKLSGEQVAEMPFKLVRTITQTRGSRDHWENTQENMFCSNALLEYSRRYEQTKPQLSVSVAVDGQVLGQTEFNDYRDKPGLFEKPLDQQDVGKRQSVTINRSGNGRLYYATRLQYAPQQTYRERVNAGIDIRREYSVRRDGRWQMLEPGAAMQPQIYRGELVRVDIYVSLPTARNFVVVEDPVPGGLEPVNRDLATASEVDAEQGNFAFAGGAWWFQFDDWQSFNVSRWSFYHQELKHDSVRFYSDYLPAGHYHLAYTAQAIAVGEFTRLPVFAEEMYDPDIFGKGRQGSLLVHEPIPK